MRFERMRWAVRWIDPLKALLAAAIVVGSGAWLWAQAPQRSAAPARLNAADEAAIRATAEAYTKAYNAADAKALAALWTADAEYVDELGHELRGRDTIARHLAGTLAAHPGTTLEVAITSIRPLSSDVAVENGTSRAKPAQGKAAGPVKYTAVHVKRDGKWLMSHVTESRHVPASNEIHLQELGWLVGEWRSESAGKTLKSKCEWMTGKSFLSRAFTVSQQDRVISSGTQVIGWDPTVEQIVSWTFDPSGGVGRDVWHQEGQRWEIEASSTLADGGTSLATNVLLKLDDNTYTWQSIERSLNAELLPDTAIVRVKRVAR